jgi:hypothetical protein
MRRAGIVFWIEPFCYKFKEDASQWCKEKSHRFSISYSALGINIPQFDPLII